MKALAVALLILSVGCTAAVAPSPVQIPTASAPNTSPSVPAQATPMAAVGELVEARSDLPRSAPDAATDEQLAAAVAADRAFAFDLYRTLIGTEAGNLFISPYSISTALSMVLAGARGPTADELADALRVSANDETWHLARNRLELQLTQLSDYQLPGNPDAVPLTLEPTNAFFGRVGYPFKQDYLDTLAANYGAGTHALDFTNQPEPSRAAINEWVAERTRERIPELLPPGFINPKTVAVLVNAIYFKANWLLQFELEDTEPAPFQALDGTTTEVQMMHGQQKWQYAAGDGWQAVELPYVGGASMLIIVPEEGRFAEIEPRLNDAFLSDIKAGLSTHQVDLRVPRWESESELDLIPPFKSLGVELLFGNADLTGIADADLFVSDIVHAANITVDEKGTEAAAATAVGIAESAAPPVSLTADRPFIYVIHDNANGEILFLGRLLAP